MCIDMSAMKKTIAVSKPVHKELAYRKIEREYNSFEEMLVTEILNEGDSR